LSGVVDGGVMVLVTETGLQQQRERDSPGDLPLSEVVAR
jgi:hypothetical protein